MTAAEHEQKRVTRRRAYARTYNETHRLQQLNSTLKSKFGITLTQYNRMLVDQGGRCAVCGLSPGERRLAVDHDHSTGKVRGLLCFRCNTASGHMEDNSILLRKLAQYLDDRK